MVRNKSMFYLDYDSPDFYKQFLNKKEFVNLDHAGNLKNYQLFLKNFINPLSPYPSLLLYHKTGTGKTLTSLSIALNFVNKINVFFIIKNKLLENNFKNQLQQFYKNDPIYKHVSKIKFITMGNLNKYSPSKFNNSIIIVDEIQNMINNSMYFVLNNIKTKAINLKLILLTATPIYDNVKEIFEISNLLNSSEHQLPIRTELLKEKYLHEPVSYKKNKNFFLTNNVYFLTKKGKEALSNTLLGKVSYLDINPDSKDFPKVSIKGKKMYNDNLILCKMSKIQEDIYNKVIQNNKDTLFKEPSYVSILGINDFDNSFTLIDSELKLYSPKGFSLKGVENISNFSSKLSELYKNILKLINKPGTVYIYSNYVNNSGVNIIKSLLLSNGFNYYTKTDKKQHGFAFFDENMTETKKNKILKLFNSPENANGDLIKIFIGSPMTSEGINFKSIRQLHILDPHWNYSRIEQIIGRSVRYQSHSYLSSKYKTVDIFKYASVSDKIPYSIDLYKYELAYEKDKAIKAVEFLLKKMAIDCHLNKIVKNSKLNYSRECQYRICDFKCNSENNDGKVEIDISTYDILQHNIEEYNYIFNKLKALFSEYTSLTLNQIVKLFSEIKYKQNIYKVLDDIISNNTILNAKYLIYKNNYYFLE